MTPKSKYLKVKEREIKKFSEMAAEWWNPYGKFRPLHKFNPIRIQYIKENTIQEIAEIINSPLLLSLLPLNLCQL